MATDTLVVYVESTPVEVSVHDTAASAALRAGLGHTRVSPLSGEKRAPYCMMGVCFECLMVIDGIASRQACLVPVRPGMRIERQAGLRELT